MKGGNNTHKRELEENIKAVKENDCGLTTGGYKKENKNTSHLILKIIFKFIIRIQMKLQTFK